MSDKKIEAECNRMLIDVVCTQLATHNLRMAVRIVRDMEGDIARLETERAALLAYCRRLDPGATDEEILAAAGCEIPADAIPETEEIEPDR